MKLLYLGDIMGRPGRNTVKHFLPGLIEQHGIDFVAAQGENLSAGKGLQVKTVEDMLGSGIDFFTGGDWTLHREEIYPWLDDPAKPVVRPANYPEGTPGRSYKIADTTHGRILFVSLLGQTVGYRAPENLQNPLLTIDRILEETKHEQLAARIVNFHGDFSSEKLVIGHYLDGRVTAVIGDHWHIPTADPQLFPSGTAHITDVGMVGSRDSSLGIKTNVIIQRWLTGTHSRNELETTGKMQLCGLLMDINTTTGQASRLEQIIKIGEF